MVSDQKLRRSRLSSTVIAGTVLLFAAACMLPPAIIFIIGFVTQTIPMGKESSIWRAAPGYPAFDPQTWLLYAPAIVMLTLSVWTFPLVMRGEARYGRYAAASFSLIMGAWSLIIGGAFRGAPGIHNEGQFAVFIFLLAWLIFVFRIVLGWLRLVPASWRVKVPREQRWLPGL